jgi:hypothetical protein
MTKAIPKPPINSPARVESLENVLVDTGSTGTILNADLVRKTGIRRAI